jgi:hypothetical protein
MVLPKVDRGRGPPAGKAACPGSRAATTTTLPRLLKVAERAVTQNSSRMHDTDRRSAGAVPLARRSLPVSRAQYRVSAALDAMHALAVMTCVSIETDACITSRDPP